MNGEVNREKKLISAEKICWRNYSSHICSLFSSAQR